MKIRTKLNLMTFCLLAAFTLLVSCAKDANDCNLKGDWYAVSKIETAQGIEDIESHIQSEDQAFVILEEIKNAINVFDFDVVQHNFDLEAYDISRDCKTIKQNAVIADDTLTIIKRDGKYLVLYSEYFSIYDIFRKR